MSWKGDGWRVTQVRVSTAREHGRGRVLAHFNLLVNGFELRAGKLGIREDGAEFVAGASHRVNNAKAGGFFLYTWLFPTREGPEGLLEWLQAIQQLMVDNGHTLAEIDAEGNITFSTNRKF